MEGAVGGREEVIEACRRRLEKYVPARKLFVYGVRSPLGSDNCNDLSKGCFVDGNYIAGEA